MKNSFLLLLTFLIIGLLVSCESNENIEIDKKVFDYDTLIDNEGNAYKIIQIGNQIWMAENLMVTKYNDGESIPNVIDDSIWINQSTAGYSWHENDASYKELGAIYNWYVTNKNICPIGWHVSTDEDWKELEIYVGMENDQIDLTGNRGTNQGDLLKSQTNWISTSPEYPENGMNEFGLDIYPMSSRSARRDTGGYFFGFSSNYNIWTPSKNDTTKLWFRFFSGGNSKIGRYDNRLRMTDANNYANYGFCIRCVKDE